MSEVRLKNLVRVGICGLGTVGSGAVNILRRNKKLIDARAGCDIAITQIASRRDNPRCDTAQFSVTRDIFEVANNPNVDILVEVIGGTDIAKKLVLTAINNGKHIVTANKALIAHHGNEIFSAAKEKGVTVAFEAAVAGGIPIIKAIREGLAANNIEWLAGIINGTGNYILTEMRDKGRSFADVLAEAQALGYAEADPTFDVEGIDAAHKLVILASLAFGIPLEINKVFTEGITKIATEDVVYAEELGYRIKNLGIARRTDKGIELRVHPTLIPEKRLIANVDGVMNAVVVKGDAVGPTLYYGAGAGAEPTGSSIVGDIVDVARTLTASPEHRVPYLGFGADFVIAQPILAIEEVETANYLRMSAQDKPGVLSKIATILSDAGISIEAMIQKEPKEGESTVPLILLTNKVQDKKLTAAIRSIENLDSVSGSVQRIRVEALKVEKKVMKYISTRGQAPALSFEEVVLTGLAPDGGLYVPDTLPQFSPQQIASWAGLSYQELAFNVMQPFVAGALDDDDLKHIIAESYVSFRHDAIAPLVQTAHNEFILELFQGPTLAFKDFALQFLGHLLDHLLKKRNQKVVVMGATSGDTGSAAIEGCRRCDNIDIFILHPHNRVSNVQRRQMTTVLAPNVFNIALEGNFDDCQNMVKASFADQSFLPPGRQLVAVNSINWARIMAQIVYYFYAGLALGAPHRPIAFSVPTGNFGDIFAGYLAKKMGLPIDQLIIGTNSNDILHRCISTNDHSKHQLQHTLSPSMDIMVSSNFERMLFDLYNRDGNTIRKLMEDFKSGAMTLSDDVLIQARELFTSCRVDDKTTLDIIRSVFESTEYLLDPHTAIGVEAARKTRRRKDIPMICLATAHPAKFPEAVIQAGQNKDPELPHHMQDLFAREERYAVLPQELKKVQEFIQANVRK